MSATGRIGMFVDGEVHSVFVHKHCNPQELGPILLQEYTSDADVVRLLGNGTIAAIWCDGPLSCDLGDEPDCHDEDYWSFGQSHDYRYLWRDGQWWLDGSGALDWVPLHERVALEVSDG